MTEEPTAMPDEVKLLPWPLFGYAPGHYSIICYRCKAEASDCDKRAIACLPCAVEQAKRHIAALTRPTLVTDEVVERVKAAINSARRVRTNPERPDNDDEYAEKLARAAIAAMPAIVGGE